MKCSRRYFAGAHARRSSAPAFPGGGRGRPMGSLRGGARFDERVDLAVRVARLSQDRAGVLSQKGRRLGGLGRGPAAGAPGGAGPADNNDAPRIAPLIETRPLLIVRRGIAGVAVDGSGTLVLDRLRWATGEER